jgi:hypothetical protein
MQDNKYYLHHNDEMLSCLQIIFVEYKMIIVTPQDKQEARSLVKGLVDHSYSQDLALKLALKHQKIGVCQVLVAELGCDPNARYDPNQTLLEYAAATLGADFANQMLEWRKQFVLK